MGNAARLLWVPIPTTNARMLNAMAPAHVKCHKAWGLALRARKVHNAPRVSALMAFVAIRRAMVRAKRVRPRKRLMGPTVPVDPLRPRRIPTVNAEVGIAMARAYACTSMASPVRQERNAFPAIVSTGIVAAILAPVLVWPVRSPNAAVDTMGNADRLQTVPILTTNAAGPACAMAARCARWLKPDLHAQAMRNVRPDSASMGLVAQRRARVLAWRATSQARSERVRSPRKVKAMRIRRRRAPVNAMAKGRANPTMALHARPELNV